MTPAEIANQLVGEQAFVPQGVDWLRALILRAIALAQED